MRKLLERAGELPVTPVPLSGIGEIDEPYWFSEADRPATCRAIMAHATQVAGVDITYPILLCAEGRVMDGMHRVMKALGDGHDTIPARQLITTPPPDYLNMAPSDLPY
ncbi:hypothetical protein [Rhodophyticola sp. CCM32]|uniref:hypothetical protein n=1 Tax=Rhodophyticola sp. CCM32 TaxID=2916397 RepID=UPI001AEF4666|nr:hypothetical protein [Rhodophyticola sp. CCM32]